MIKTAKLVLSICLFCGAISVFAEEGLELRIAVPKSSIVMYEPLVVDVQLTNEGEKDALVIQAMEIIFQVYRYYISTNGITFNEIGPRIMFDWEPPALPLKSKSSVSHLQLLLYDGNTGGVVFSKPGEYFVKVKLVRGMLLESNIVKVEIKEVAEDIKSRKTYKKIQEEKVRQHLQWPITAEIGKPIEIELLNLCSSEDTVYRPYIRYIFAARAMESLSENGPKDADLTLFNLADVEGFPLQSMCIFYKGITYQKLNQQKKAEGEFKRLMEKFPNSYAAWRLQKEKQGKK